MEKIKINIAELLRDCPEGMELDCTMYDNLYFDKVDDYDKKIHCYIQYKDHRTHILLGKDGTYNSEKASKCVIFPKGKTSWEGFVPPGQFTDGDVVVSSLGHIHILKNRSTSYIFVDFVHNSNGSLCKSLTTGVRVDRMATEEEKAKLFQVIKDNGYRWNEETKTLEELPKFKVGDKIFNVLRKLAGASGAQGIISEITDDKYIFTDGSYIYINSQDNWELVSVEPQFNVGDRIRHKNDKTIHTINYVYYDNYALCDGHSILFKDQDLYELVPFEPTFNVGDKIKHKDDKTVITITGIKDNYYLIQFYNLNKNDYQNEKVSFKDQDKYELVSEFKDGDVIFCENHWGSFISIFKENVTEINGFIGHCVFDVDDNEFKVKDSASYFNKVRFATKSEKELLFRVIKKNGYKWNPDNKALEKSTPNPDKFDITSLKTFDQVLVRDFDNTPWEIEFFSRLLDGKHFKCSGLSYMQCIPYKGNEHLNGKKDDCNKYFKTWE